MAVNRYISAGRLNKNVHYGKHCCMLQLPLPGLLIVQKMVIVQPEVLSLSGALLALEACHTSSYKDDC